MEYMSRKGRPNTLYPGVEYEEKSMKETLNFFKHNDCNKFANYQKGILGKENILKDFLELIKENQLVGQPIKILNIFRGSKEEH